MQYVEPTRHDFGGTITAEADGGDDIVLTLDSDAGGSFVVAMSQADAVRIGSRLIEAAGAFRAGLIQGSAR